jgi:hypothetical protein
MATDPERKLIFQIKPIGNVVQLTGGPVTPVGPPPKYDDDCYPPTPACPVPVATYVSVPIKELQRKSRNVNIAELAFHIQNGPAQELRLMVHISEGEGKEYLWNEKFVTNNYKLQAAGKSTYVIGLDHAAQKAAQPYFVPGNTLALVVLPLQKEHLFKVVVGTAAQGAAASK